MYYSSAHLPRGMFVGPLPGPKKGGFVRTLTIFRLEKKERKNERGGHGSNDHLL